MKKRIIEYIAKPYESYNCFDLVRDFYLTEFDIELSNYFDGGPVPDRREVETLIVSNKGDFVKVDKPEYGDVVVIALYGLECHIGVCINQTDFLHSRKGTGSTMEKLSRYGKMVAGFYRHKAKA